VKRGFLIPVFLCIAAILAFAMGTLFRLRLLPFLRPNTILSGGKQVPTEQFTDLMSKGFYIAGATTLVLALAAAVSLLRSRRKKPSRRPAAE
jgi:hypothetical protein